MATRTKLTLKWDLPFMSFRRIALGASALLVLLSFASFLFRGLDYGIDFSGGILVEIRVDESMDIATLRGRMAEAGQGGADLQEFGSEGGWMIRLPRSEGEGQQMEGVRELRTALGEGVEYRRVEAVGPKVSAELLRAATLAIVMALLGVLVYIWFRFELRFGLAALLALSHDVVLAFGFFSVTGLEFNLASVAAILTIAGYSINDTVVIFDRVRENLRKFKKMEADQLCNRSISETMSRTLLTSGTTLIAVLILTLFGGPVVAGFSAVLLWGILIGTYSSIFVALGAMVSTGSSLRPPEIRDSEPARP